MYVRDMIYETADGQYITVGTVTMKEWTGLCTALARPDWLSDKRFADAAGLARHRAERLEMICDQVRTMPAAEILTLLDQHNVPCGPVNHPRERILEDTQVLHNQLVQKHSHPEVLCQQLAVVCTIEWPCAWWVVVWDASDA